MYQSDNKQYQNSTKCFGIRKIVKGYQNGTKQIPKLYQTSDKVGITKRVQIGTKWIPKYLVLKECQCY